MGCEESVEEAETRSVAETTSKLGLDKVSAMSDISTESKVIPEASIKIDQTNPSNLAKEISDATVADSKQNSKHLDVDKVVKAAISVTSGQSVEDVQLGVRKPIEIKSSNGAFTMSITSADEEKDNAEIDSSDSSSSSSDSEDDGPNIPSLGRTNLAKSVLGNEFKKV